MREVKMKKSKKDKYYLLNLDQDTISEALGYYFAERFRLDTFDSKIAFYHNKQTDSVDAMIALTTHDMLNRVCYDLTKLDLNEKYLNREYDELPKNKKWVYIE
jgi:hypothetical protein